MRYWIVLLVSSFSILLFSQDRPKTVAADLRTPILPLHLQSKVDLQGQVGALFAAPSQCGEDGRIYARFSDDGMKMQLVGIATDGKISHFSIPGSNIPGETLLESFFPVGNTLQAHVVGRIFKENTTRRVKAKRQNGEEVDLGMRPSGELIESHYWVTFDQDGKLKSLQKLEDWPFRILQVAPLPPGLLLVSGIDDSLKKPMVAVAGEDGRPHRMLNLDHDLSSESGTEESKPEQIARIMAASHFYVDGDRVLLVRLGAANSPVYALSAAADPQPIKVQAPEGYSLFSISPSKEGWMAQFARKDERDLYHDKLCLTDRNTGKLIRCYKPDAEVGFGFTCVNDGKYFFIGNSAGGSRPQLWIAGE